MTTAIGEPEAVVRQYGSVMRQYVEVGDDIIADKDALQALWARCVANARQLKAKPTKRTKSS